MADSLHRPTACKRSHSRPRPPTWTAVVVAAVVAFVAAGCTPPPVTTNPPPGATGPSPGCGVTTRGPVTDHAESVAGRRYTITVPPQHTPETNTPLPLVLDFHGLLEGWATTHPFATQFSAKAIAEGFVVAYPIGQSDGVYWDVSAQEGNPDLRFVDALVSELQDTLCIDRSRMYITGLSFGAAMTSMLMCMRANTFAAAAPVAGIKQLCTPTQRKVPFVTFHGTADPILPFGDFAATPGRIATGWGCADPPTVTTLQPDPDPVTGGPITRTVWDCGAVDSAAEFYVIGGGGHSWPGSTFFSWIPFIVGPTTMSLDATDVIWDFFTRHHL